MSIRRDKEQKELASRFIEVIKILAISDGQIQNLESYLSCHFDVWMEKYANTPEDLVVELEAFAKMKL